MVNEWEALKKAENGLREGVNALTWAGMLWGRLGAIRLSKLRYEFLRELNRHDVALSALASAYYTASGHARARATTGTAWLERLGWFILSGWYLKGAVRLSDRLARFLSLADMSPDQLGVRASILSKARRIGDALCCIEEALGRNGVTADTRSLLLSSLGATHSALGNATEAAKAYRQARELLDRIQPSTRVRVLRASAEFNLASIATGEQPVSPVTRAWAIRDLNTALQLAYEHHLHDQVVKIQAILEKLAK